MRSIIEKNKKSKKAVSNMVSYVLLVIITLSTATAVYGFLKFQANIPTDEGTCPEDTALTLKTYSCDNVDNTISFTLQNKGLFSIDGFFIRGSKTEEALATIPLKRTDKPEALEGRYDFETKFAPQETISTTFSYLNTLPEGIKKIQIQPFVFSAGKLASCTNIITLKLNLDEVCTAASDISSEATGLISYWKLDGDIQDIEGTNDGNLIIGDTSFTTGIKGQAASFDGEGDYIEIPNSASLDLTDEITISAFFKLNSIEQNKIIIHKGSAYGLWYDWSGSEEDNNELQFMFVDSSDWRVCDTDFTPNINTWYHLVGTYDKTAGECKTYVNGQLKKTKPYSTAIRSSTTPIIIGGHNSGTYDLNGLVDEVRIYNKALSKEEILTIYNSVT